MSELKSIALPETILTHTATIAAAYVGRNSLAVDEIAHIVRIIHSALTKLEGGKEATVEAPPEPAVPVKKSVFPDHIICLEDGKKFKMLKRHLHTVYNMTTEEYRSKWGLPNSYPMVAPNYAAIRSGIAKEAGLGRRA